MRAGVPGGRRRSRIKYSKELILRPNAAAAVADIIYTIVTIHGDRIIDVCRTVNSYDQMSLLSRIRKKILQLQLCVVLIIYLFILISPLRGL